MNRPAILIAALVTLGIAAINVVLGRNLIMPLEQAQKGGVGVPWYIVWVMIGMTVVSALALGLFLILATVSDARRR
jgi:hypothetical protein